MTLLADTSGLLVLLDASHDLHSQVLTLAQKETITVPSSVLVEIDYLTTKYLGAEVARVFFEDILEGAYDFILVDMTDIKRGVEIMNQFKDADIGFVDASIVALAERYKLQRVLTLDKRHFSCFKPKGLGFLELLP